MPKNVFDSASVARAPVLPADPECHKDVCEDPGCRVLKAAKLTYCAGHMLDTVECVVINISRGGACVLLEHKFLPEYAFLQMQGDVLRPVRRCWTDDNGRLGLAFCSTDEFPPLPNL
ncbi:hypothetical protein [Acidocella aromatica]|uniref:PilZ domain-containing protein n=1 Tax=Acidocella aromatica TaxID=1303579 RepID=A0A840VLS6_9PROT|nr:hypothetical protein [Acidocella aromatica]MBB5372420.1 hypothetical protein [Acidocella aromatica]